MKTCRWHYSKSDMAAWLRCSFVVRVQHREIDDLLIWFCIDGTRIGVRFRWKLHAMVRPSIRFRDHADLNQTEGGTIMERN